MGKVRAHPPAQTWNMQLHIQNGTKAELEEWTPESKNLLHQEPIKKEKSLLQGKAYKYRPFRTNLLVNHNYKI